jgi:hypothetical protein
LKIWIFALLTLLFSLIAAAVLAPANRDPGKMETAARIEFQNYRVYSIGRDVVFGILIAEEGRVFADREELSAPIVFRIAESNLSDGVSAAKAVMKGDDLFLNANVNYWDALGRTLKTDRATYNRKNEILKGAGGFTLASAEGVMSGKSFALNVATREFAAREIKALINDESF